MPGRQLLQANEYGNGYLTTTDGQCRRRPFVYEGHFGLCPLPTLYTMPPYVSVEVTHLTCRFFTRCYSIYENEVVCYNVGNTITNVKVRGPGPHFEKSEGPKPLDPAPRF